MDKDNCFLEKTKNKNKIMTYPNESIIRRAHSFCHNIIVHYERVSYKFLNVKYSKP